MKKNERQINRALTEVYASLEQTSENPQDSLGNIDVRLGALCESGLISDGVHKEIITKAKEIFDPNLKLTTNKIDSFVSDLRVKLG